MTKKNSNKKQRQDSNNVQGDTEMTYHNYQHQCPVPVPSAVNIDDIAVYSDEELFSRLASMENDRLKVVESRFDPTSWEIEIAYLRREMGIRRQRREAHEIYIRENAHLLQEEEVTVDFDDASVGLA